MLKSTQPSFNDISGARHGGAVPMTLADGPTSPDARGHQSGITGRRR